MCPGEWGHIQIIENDSLRYTVLTQYVPLLHENILSRVQQSFQMLKDAMKAKNDKRKPFEDHWHFSIA